MAATNRFNQIGQTGVIRKVSPASFKFYAQPSPSISSEHVRLDATAAVPAITMVASQVAELTTDLALQGRGLCRSHGGARRELPVVLAQAQTKTKTSTLPIFPKQGQRPAEVKNKIKSSRKCCGRYRRLLSSRGSSSSSGCEAEVSWNRRTMEAPATVSATVT